MIDISVQPSQVAEARRDIREIIQRHNRYNEYRQIDLRHHDGKFMSTDEWLWVIDNTDRADGEFFIRIEFDDDILIAQEVAEHFGHFNVGYC